MDRPVVSVSIFHLQGTRTRSPFIRRTGLPGYLYGRVVTDSPFGIEMVEAVGHTPSNFSLSQNSEFRNMIHQERVWVSLLRITYKVGVPQPLWEGDGREFFHTCVRVEPAIHKRGTRNGEECAYERRDFEGGN